MSGCWVAAVVRDEDDRVLLVRRGDTQAWDLPAGPLRPGEDPYSAVRRVVADTAAIGVSVGWLAGVHAHVRDGVTLVFLARHTVGRVTPRGEVQRCRWVTADAALRMLWPRRADQLDGAVTGRDPQPVVISVRPHLPPVRAELSDRRNPAGCVAGDVPRVIERSGSR